MCIRLNAKELLANLLGSKQLRVGTVIKRNDLYKFQEGLSNLIPGHIYYETTNEDILDAVIALRDYCKLDDNGAIRCLAGETRPSRYEANHMLPSIAASVLPSFADYFVETNLS